jgi:phage baseplate assembly protein gpV
MRSFRLTALALALSLPVAAMIFQPVAMAQSTTSGDISGDLLDPTGAAIPGAKVVVKNTATGESKTVTSNSGGSYRVSLLVPGTYQVTVTAPGFTVQSNVVEVSAGTVATNNLKLTVGSGSQEVTVSAAAETVNLENADVVTTFTAEQVQAMPNPGNDLTFVAQTAPGSVMNTGTTAGGYGNFSSFGISGLSNMFTLDGGYENDPFLNLNNTGASNLTLGNNEVDTVTVISPAFSSQFGGLGGAQVNEITASGGNRIHGNASYYWDGRALNSNDYFNKQAEITNGTQNIPQFVNANQWGASIGGPIIKNRLFWFVNTEGIRATTPSNGLILAPSPLAEACTRGQDPGNETYATCATLNAAADAATLLYNDPVTHQGPVSVGLLADDALFAPAAPGQLPQMNRVFNTFDTSSYRPANSSPYIYDPATVSYYAHSSENLTEWLLTARIDYKIGDKDNFYIHYKQDHGTQPTYTDLVSPLFTDLSVQPAWEGQMSETHLFTPNLTNQLVVTGNYYSAPFQNSNPTATVQAAAPSTVEFENGGLSSSTDYYGGINYAFPQGRRVAGYQVIDDLNWTKGRHTLRFGYNIRRDNITDLQGEETTYPVSITYEEDFLSGITDVEYIQRFPQRPSQPVSVYNEGFYVEDMFKVSPKLTLTAGLRFETNSNPICHTSCYNYLASPVSYGVAGSAPTTSPYSSAFPGGLIDGNRYQAFKSFQKLALMPRIGVNYQVTPKTTMRAGFGMFTDSFPGVVADALLSNAPTNFHAAVYAPYSGAGSNFLGYDLTVPAQPNTPAYGTILNPATVASASAAAFQTGFYAGSSEQQIAAAVGAAGGHFSTPSITTVAPKINYPTYEEWSMAIEQRINNKTSLLVTYVGNHGYHEPVSDASPNLTNSGAGPGNFNGVATSKPFASFATVTNIYSGASSNYNGIVFSAKRQAKDLSLQFNYEFSKALDEVSNGGFEPYAPDAGDSAALVVPGNLHANYGPADYNVKHNVTASFVYELPTLIKTDSTILRALIGGFEFSGDVFHNSGLPYSITQSTTSTSPANPDGSPSTAGLQSSFANGTFLLLAQKLNNNFDHHCGGSSHVVNVVTGVLNTPCDFVNSFAAPNSFATGQSRNSLVGPSYTNVDFGAFKTFGLPIPHMRDTKLKLGAQFFNLFNHTNFQNPGHARGANNAQLGGIQATVGAPTSILGSTGGADASPRLIQLHASLVF